MFQTEREQYFAAKLEYEIKDVTQTTHLFVSPQPELKCWYEGYELPNDSPPVALPVARVGVSGFRFIGRFCSWSCCLAYNTEKSEPHLRSQREEWIREIARVLSGIPFTAYIPDALPRAVLQGYGGYMSITDYRKYQSEVISAKAKKEWCATFTPYVSVEQGIVHDPSNLVYEYTRRTIHIIPSETRFVIHAKGDVSKIKYLPSVESLQKKVKLPVVVAPGTMKAFDPKKETPLLSASPASSQFHHSKPHATTIATTTALTPSNSSSNTSSGFFKQGHFRKKKEMKHTTTDCFTSAESSACDEGDGFSLNSKKRRIV